MPVRITMVVDAFQGDKGKDYSHACLRILLDALQKIDEQFLIRNPKTPLLYESGVYYQEEPPGAEDWPDPSVILKLGAGDCEDLACWRAAELNVRWGIKARTDFRSQKRPDGSYLYHIFVALPDGRTEDPSRELGMK